MSKLLLATGAALLLATSILAGPASATEHKSAATVSAKSPAVASVDLSARRYHRYYRHYGYRRPYYGYGRPYPYYAYAPGPYYYRPYYRPFPFGFFPFY
jgi:hypothetical protein